MPELPEVETIAARLRDGCDEHPSLIGLYTQSADVIWERTIATPGAQEFCQRIIGQRISAISRRGKYLVAKLSGDWLLVHLRMSGDILIEPSVKEKGKHDRVRLYLEQGLRLTFTDPRKFGRVWLVDDPEGVLGGLGPEPLDESFTPQHLHNRMRSTRRQVKPLLLDQTIVAGLGNIYTDEALHLARIHPLQASNTLSFSDTERLWSSIQAVLRDGIKRNGTSIDWVYRGGDYQRYLRVYRRTGEPCPVCATPIEKIIVGQRGTHFCPVCQEQFG